MNNVRFKEIVFDNVYISSESKSLPMSSKWPVLPVFAERSDVIKLITGGNERVLQPKDVAEAEFIAMDETYESVYYQIDSEHSDYESDEEDEDTAMTY